jgi:putative transposase
MSEEPMKKSKFTEEQIVRILQEAAAGTKTQAELCREHGVSQNTFYVWKRKYSGLETDDVKRLRELERENEQLKILLAERDLEIAAVKKVFRKNAWTLPSELRERS